MKTTMNINEAKAGVRALLTSCPHSCRLKKLLREFKRTKGCDLPLFGFNNHIELLKSFNDIVQVIGETRNPRIRLVREEFLAERSRGVTDELILERRKMEENMRRQNAQKKNLDFQGYKKYSSTQNAALQDEIAMQDEACAMNWPDIHNMVSIGDLDDDQLCFENSNLREIDIGERENDEKDMGPEDGWQMEKEVGITVFLKLCLQWFLNRLLQVWHRLSQNIGMFMY